MVSSFSSFVFGWCREIAVGKNGHIRTKRTKPEDGECEKNVVYITKLVLVGVSDEWACVCLIFVYDIKYSK